MADASSKLYPGWESERRLRCKICGAEMAHVLAAYDSFDKDGNKRSEFVEELECSNCGKSMPLSKKPKQSYSRKSYTKKKGRKRWR